MKGATLGRHYLCADHLVDWRTLRGRVAGEAEVQRRSSGWKLKLLQIFREASRAGKDVFETYP
jgi:hypothetical protein